MGDRLSCRMQMYVFPSVYYHSKMMGENWEVGEHIWQLWTHLSLQNIWRSNSDKLTKNKQWTCKQQKQQIDHLFEWTFKTFVHDLNLCWEKMGFSNKKLMDLCFNEGLNRKHHLWCMNVLFRSLSWHCWRMDRDFRWIFMFHIGYCLFLQSL